MNYLGRDRVKVLVVFPDVVDTILERRKRLGLSEIAIEELEYGMDEVMEVVNSLDAKLLSGGRANLLGLMDILRQGWDIIWLITHGEPEGWYLTDGLVNASEMTTLIRSAGIFLTVMNTCSSYEVAKTAARELGTAFICTLTPVPDRQAFITGTIFAQKLADGYDYVTAHALAEPGQKHPYVLIEANETMRSDRPRRTELDYDTVNRILHSLEELEHIIHGSKRLNLLGLKDLMHGIQADLKEIRNQLEKIQERQRIRNIAMWGMGISILLLLATVAILISRIGVIA